MRYAENIVISDVRFDNEARAIREMGGFVIEIIRPGIKSVKAHSSEGGIDRKLIDKYVANSGTIDNLHERIRSIIDFA